MTASAVMGFDILHAWKRVSLSNGFTVSTVAEVSLGCGEPMILAVILPAYRTPTETIGVPISTRVCCTDLSLEDCDLINASRRSNMSGISISRLELMIA
jgi:hypothetical protein